MAIVFVSPKQKQRLFLAGIIALFVLVLISIAFFVFLSKPASTILQQSFKKTEIKINFEVLDSDKVKYLSVVEKMELQFTYTAVGPDDKPVVGKILAVSEEKALEDLRNMKLTNIVITASSPGRVDPFASYYQIKALPIVKPTIKK